MKLTSILFTAITGLLLSTSLFAQTAQRVENLLGEQAITWSRAAAFALEASDKLLYGSEADAFRFAMDRRWLPKNAEPGDTARLNGIALLLMRSFDQKGGAFYSLSKSPHYAYRELVFKGIIQGKSDPEMIVSGEEFLFLINRILSMRNAETEQAEAERRKAEEEKLAQEINAMLAAQKVADTTAKVTEEGVTISLSNIQFRANSTELPDSEKAKVREIGVILETIPERNILVAGHTASAGSREEQQRTSLERAQAVADYLVSLRVRTAAEITVQGYGADRPIASNRTEAGMAQNRRVEITIVPGGRR